MEEYESIVNSKEEDDKPPNLVLPAPHLFRDLRMLEALFENDTPVEVPVRFGSTVEVYCGFFVASGRGLGSMLQGNDEGLVRIRMRVWSCTELSERSSN